MGEPDAGTLASEAQRVWRGALRRARGVVQAAAGGGGTTAVPLTPPPVADATDLEPLTARVDGLEEALRVQTEVLGSVEAWVRSCVRVLANFGVQPMPDRGDGDRDRDGGSGSGADPDEPDGRDADVLGSLAARLDVWVFMEWLRHTSVADPGPLVSVNIATRDRPESLRRAIDSVLAQSYRHLEVVVADDSTRDETAAVLDSIDDPRLTSVRVRREHTPGAGTACNAALDASRGDVIAFLDDDNTMHPDWIRAVVWAFTTYPQYDVLYGARLNQDAGAQGGVPSGMLPSLEFQRYDRRRHERANYIDRNAMAMRAALKSVRFDESLPNAADWDHQLRVFMAHRPLALPAISCNYMTAHAGRLSDSVGAGPVVEMIRQRHRERTASAAANSGEAPG